MGQITKQIKGKIIFKHETEADWKLSSYVPDEGEQVIYDPDASHPSPRIKIGDGKKVVDALPFTTAEIPTKLSEFENDVGYLKIETDPTVHAWAKAEIKPSYTAAEVGALPDTTVIPTVPTNVSAFTNDVGYLTEHQSLEGLATEAYVQAQIATIPTPDVSGQIGEHNVSTLAHNDIRLLIEGLTTRLNTLANSDDTTLDQMAELVKYIKDNRELIEGVTTNKVNVSDIINDLTTNVTNKPLSAAQGVALKNLIDALGNSKLDASALGAAVNQALLIAKESGEFKGETGATGPRGPQGPAYTLTETDKALIVAQVIESLGGEPIFGYVDEDNNIIVQGNLADGTYSVKYEIENEDGTVTTVDIGNLVLDTNVYYSVTKNLTNCTINNTATQVVAGGSYSATVTANSGYTLDSVSVTMGGSAVSVSGGVINIASVTGDIVITAVASEAVVEPSYTNLLPLSVDENGNDFKGQDAKGGDGYEYGYKLSGSSTNGTPSATSGAYVSGFIPINDQYDVVRIKNITLYQGTSVNNIIFYDTNKGKLYAATGNAGNSFHSYVQESNGVYSFEPSSWASMPNIGFFRFSCGGISDDTIVTVNEEIV